MTVSNVLVHDKDRAEHTSSHLCSYVVGHHMNEIRVIDRLTEEILVELDPSSDDTENALRIAEEIGTSVLNRLPPGAKTELE